MNLMKIFKGMPDAAQVIQKNFEEIEKNQKEVDKYPTEWEKFGDMQVRFLNEDTVQSKGTFKSGAVTVVNPVLVGTIDKKYVQNKTFFISAFQRTGSGLMPLQVNDDGKIYALANPNPGDYFELTLVTWTL